MDISQAERSGSVAWRCLRTDGPAEVVTVFRRSIYLSTPRGLVCFGPRVLGDGPPNVLCGPPSAFDFRDEVAARERVAVEGGRVRIGPGLAIDLRSVRRWRPPPRVPWDAGTLERRLARVVSAAETFGPPRGFGVWLLDLASGRMNRGDRMAMADPLTAAAVPGLAALEAWGLDRRRNGFLSQGVLSLVGLGGGLTPSGDDFLGGLMIALRSFGEIGLTREVARTTLSTARAGTGLISFAHLRCAALGMGAEVVHDVLAYLMGSADGKEEERIRAIDRLGHSSGWDTLAGVVFSAAALLRALAPG
jgi:hypothetical protein